MNFIICAILANGTEEIYPMNDASAVRDMVRYLESIKAKSINVYGKLNANDIQTETCPFCGS